MQLYFLGTGAGIPSKKRNVSSLALRLTEYGGETWLFDCGEATQHQIMHSPVKLSKVNRIFITHLHGDHIFGLPGLLGTRSFQGVETSLTLYGPVGLRSFIKTALHTSETHLRYPLNIQEINESVTRHRSDLEASREEKRKATHRVEGCRSGEISLFQSSPFTVKTALLDHGLPSYGFRIEEKDRPGTLQVDKLKQLGIAPGPIYQHLKYGETVELADGRKFKGDDFLGPPKKGRTLAILGDTRPTEHAYTLAHNADLLVHEATFRADQKQLADQFYHSTATQAARIAERSHVGTLILSHLSSRYAEDEWDSIVEEARAIFPNTYLARDHGSYTLERSENAISIVKG